MNLKSNLNRIHFYLTEKYDEVKLEEKSDIKLGNFIEFTVLENNKELKMRITKYELEKDSFNWMYFSNPEDEQSIVERFSSVEKFANDVEDIFVKNRFDSDYLKKLS